VKGHDGTLERREQTQINTEKRDHEEIWLIANIKVAVLRKENGYHTNLREEVEG